MHQMLEVWYDKSTFAMATWRGDAQRYWLTQVLEPARVRREQWLQSAPAQRATLEPACVLGDRKHIPEAPNAVESVLRTELLDVIPKPLAEACMRHGYCTAELIVWYVMKQLVLPPDGNEVTMQKEILAPPKVPPATLDQASTWLEEMQHRLSLCIKTKQNVHPRTIVAFVNETLSGVTPYYRTVGNIWDSLYSKHQLRESNITLHRVYTMLAEFLIELKLNEEQDKITQIVTGSNGAAKHSMYDEYINASKGKVPSKGKGKGGDGKGGKSNWRAPCNEAMNSGSQTVAHKDITVRSIIQGDSQGDVRSVALHVTIYLNVHVQTNLKANNAECDDTAWQQEEVGMAGACMGDRKSMKLPRAKRKEKATGLSRRASLRERAHQDRLHQDHLSPNLLASD